MPDDFFSFSEILVGGVDYTNAIYACSCWKLTLPPPSLILESIYFSCWISASYCFNNASFGSSLIVGLFLIFLAREAYLSVDRVSSKL